MSLSLPICPRASWVSLMISIRVDTGGTFTQCFCLRWSKTWTYTSLPCALYKEASILMRCISSKSLGKTPVNR
jgi:hypothetical protein